MPHFPTSRTAAATTARPALRLARHQALLMALLLGGAVLSLGVHAQPQPQLPADRTTPAQQSQHVQQSQPFQPPAQPQMQGQAAGGTRPATTAPAMQGISPSGNMKAAFDRADTNKDGKLSPQEAAATLPAVAERFTQIDTDRDGMLSRQEFEKGVKS